MNGSLEGNTAKFTSKDTNGVNISNGQTFVVKATLTGEIADNAEFYFEVKDFTINEPASKQSENTTKSIKFINPTIFLKGIQSQSEKIVGDSYAVNVIEIALQKVQDPKLFTIILEKEEGLATGNIDSIILAGITGEYLAENQYKFDFGTTGLQINDSDKLSLTLNFTGTDEELKEKKI
ncbi:hypothetical protein IJM86_05640 [bacterium]|nr:hypothetical protein [bacterium]